MNALQLTVLGYAFRIAQPAYLLGIALGLVVAALGVFLAVRRSRQLARLFPGEVRAAVAPSASPARQGVRTALSGLALACFAVGLAQPQCGTHTELARRFGIDLVIAIDASRSMLARDVKPSRLERAKLELATLLDRLEGDRVGLVVFAGDAFTQCPLTADYAAAKMFLKAIDPASMPVQGTNLARALEESKDLLLRAERGAKARAIVLLTDGEDTAQSRVQDRVRELRELGIRVIAVGIGSPTGEPVPVHDAAGRFIGYKKDASGATVLSRLDAAGLQAVADGTGGRFIQAAPGSVGIAEVAEQLDRLEKTELESRLTVKYDERYQRAVLPGVVLLLAGALVRPSRKERS